MWVLNKKQMYRFINTTDYMNVWRKIEGMSDKRMGTKYMNVWRNIEGMSDKRMGTKYMNEWRKIEGMSDKRMGIKYMNEWSKNEGMNDKRTDTLYRWDKRASTSSLSGELMLKCLWFTGVRLLSYQVIKLN